MEQAEYGNWLIEGGYVVIPKRLLENSQALDIPPENLGYLVLAMACCQKANSVEEVAENKGVKWCLGEGWACWQGEGEKRHISFLPLWKRLHSVSLLSRNGKNNDAFFGQNGGFDYSKILKWLDQARGTLSITDKEKQVIQEFNIKYGWSTEFIIIFLELAFERGQQRLQNYQYIAKRVYESGINTVEGLIGFMNEWDWTRHKVVEIKKCIGQYGGVTGPQREMYLKWNKQWGLSHELIMRAGEETIRANNPSFKYIDAILQDWHKKGIKDVSEAEDLIKDHDEKNHRQRKVVKGENNKKRISRADERDWENIT